ncbi:Zinc phosphodiesterase ELAC protein 2, partial [Podochytrium sp. JEL0797]
MKYHLQVIGTASIDTRASVAVVFDSQRYLFNCGEGIQRFLSDRSRTCSAVSGAKTRNMFFTRTAWQCVGGLPGMILTLADAGGKGFTIRGPPGLTHSLAAMRQFLYRPQLPVQVKEYTHDETFEDSNMTVKAVLLAKQPAVVSVSKTNGNGKRALESTSTRETQIEAEVRVLGQMFNANVPVEVPAGLTKKQKNDLVGTRESEIPEESKHPLADNATSRATRANVKRLDPCEKSETVVAYVCKGPKVLGKFNVAAAQKLGIPKGKLYGQLTRGMAVTLEDGRVIQPSECAGEPKPGSMFIIVDCPSVDYIPSIQSNADLAASAHSANPVQCIVHLLGDDVVNHKDYKTWMNSFGPQCQHIVSSPQNCPQEIVLTCTAGIQHDLNYAENAVFPKPYCNNVAEVPLETIKGLPKSTTPARPLLMYQFEPKPLLDSSAVLPPFAPTRSPTDAAFNQFKIEADAVRPLLHFADPSRPVEVDDMVCLPLGTGAAIPGKYRNVSSTYLRFSDGGMFLDAGEGTLAQFYRHYGPEGVDRELKALKCIFVSHLHADHHLGAISILKRVHELKGGDANAEPVCVVGPTRYLTWLSEYADVEEFGFERLVLVDSKDLMRGSDKNNVERLKQITHMSQFQTMLVKHCAQSYALVLTHALSKLKIAFSGDCRPSDFFVQVGKGCDLVIHEATLADEKMVEAVDKNHCTTGEAIEIGK